MNEQVLFSIFRRKWRWEVRWRRKVKEANPGSLPPLVTENQTDLSREKDIFHEGRKGMRRKMKILKLEHCSARVLMCSSPPLSHATKSPNSSWEKVGVSVASWPCDHGKPCPGASVPSSVLAASHLGTQRAGVSGSVWSHLEKPELLSSMSLRPRCASLLVHSGLYQSVFVPPKKIWLLQLLFPRRGITSTEPPLLLCVRCSARQVTVVNSYDVDSLS